MFKDATKEFSYDTNIRFLFMVKFLDKTEVHVCTVLLMNMCDIVFIH